MDVEERRVSGRARPWRARRASMAVNAEVAGPNMAGGAHGLARGAWDKGPGMAEGSLEGG